MYWFLRSLVLASLPAFAAGAAPRELHTDRPDQTESPYTVDAGRWQVELDAVNATFDRDRAGGGDVRTRTWSVAPFNLKYGLTDRMDLQFMAEPFTSVGTEDRVAATKARVSGFGDVTTRLKINFWGNDGGTTAFGIMPFVKWPLPASGLRNGKLEGGIILPLAVSLSAGWSLGAMTELDFVRDEAGERAVEWLNSVTLGRELTERWNVYVELVAVTGDAPGFAWQGQFDAGFTCALDENLQLDFGCNFGLTRSAPDYQPFVGISRRF